MSEKVIGAKMGMFVYEAALDARIDPADVEAFTAAEADIQTLANEAAPLSRQAYVRHQQTEGSRPVAVA